MTRLQVITNVREAITVAMCPVERSVCPVCDPKVDAILAALGIPADAGLDDVKAGVAVIRAATQLTLDGPDDDYASVQIGVMGSAFADDANRYFAQVDRSGDVYTGHAASPAAAVFQLLALAATLEAAR